ncbi:hypothetical protein ACIQVR_38075 [Streptomyces xanthochromogenes]|uniref:hypothetical protein n=1 Tax=Streptomyces xanthochromogenes TaxID=67384 RepID=UPI003818E6E8
MRVVVSPPDERGWRKVRYDGKILGTAQASDIGEFLRLAGHPDSESVELTDESLFEWRGGGPETWADSPP